MKRSEVVRYLVLRSIGNFLLLFSLFGVVATFGPALYYEATYRVDQIKGVHYSVPQSETELGKLIQEQKNPAQNQNFQEVLSNSNERILIPKDTEFSILIPKIGASAQVFPNVDVSNENEYLPILQQGVAHAKGSVFPGLKGTTYLFAHSTDNFWDVGRYNAVFYLLKDLQPGDDIVVFFQNKRHDYKVSETKIVESSDVSYLLNSQNQNTEQLVLQTCWPPGTAWKRLLVIAKPK